MVLASSRRLYNLINDIIDISNLEHNELKIYPKSLDIRMVAETVIFTLEYLKGEKEIVFQNLIPQNTPFVLCDEDRMIQIFYNLLENALKFTEEGYIKVNAKLSDSTITIFVEDTGIGIEKNNLDNIFNFFGKENYSINRMYQETGIGLYITKQLIELQGGNVGVKSEYGKGARFFFTLPLAKEQPEKGMKKIESSLNVKKSQVEEINDEEKLNKYNILAIQYDPISLKALINNLCLYGYTVQGVRRGYDALKLMDNGIKFDTVILDIMMPDISGYDILKQIREKYLPVELPVLLLTTSRGVHDIATGFRLGANDYLIKPFEHEELNARVGSLINMKKAVNSLVETELSFLQAQIKPHFIYNALSVISSLSLVEPEKAKALILDLSDYLRGSFDFENKNGLTTLKKELNIVKAYLAIEQARFKERLCVEFETNDLNCTIPMLLAVSFIFSFVLGTNFETKKAYAAELIGAHHAVGGDDVFLGGNFIEVGVNKYGSFGTASAAPTGFHPVGRSNLGMSADGDGFDVGNASNTGDFFLPGNPYESYVVAYKDAGGTITKSQVAARNYELGITNISTTDTSSGNTLSATTVGTTSDGKLEITQVVSFDVNDKYFNINVTYKNLSGDTLYDARYLRSVDPDQDADKNYNYDTKNSVVENPPEDGRAVVIAKGGSTNEPFLYIASDSRARASITNETNPYSTACYQEDGANMLSSETTLDTWIATTFALGDIAAGESVSLDLINSLNPDISEALNSGVISPPTAVEITKDEDTLTAQLENEDGTEYTTSAAVTYDWYRDDELIQSGANNTYTITNDDKGSEIVVKVDEYDLESDSLYIENDEIQVTTQAAVVVVTRDEDTLT